MASPNDSVFVSRELAESSRDLVKAWKRGSLIPPAARPKPVTGGYLPPIRGILLADLNSDSTADCAVTTLVNDTTIQEVILLGQPTGGTFKLSFKGQTTSALAWNITAADLQTALEKLETIGPNNVTVALGQANYTNADADPGTDPTAEFPGLWLVTFTGQFDGRTDTPLMTVDDSGLRGGPSAAVIATTSWADTGKVTTVRSVIPVGTPTPMHAGAVVIAIHFPGQCYGVVACEPRSFGPPY